MSVSRLHGGRHWVSALAALLALSLAAEGYAADRPKPKPWQTLDNCRYMDRKGNDGDSFGLQCGQQKFVLRLYFVDAPETNLTYGERSREQAEHFGASLDDTLKAGYQARDLVRNALGAGFLVLTKKASAPGRSSEPRYYGLVHVGGRYLHEVLLVEGLARPKGVSSAMPDGERSRDYLKKLGALEEQARLQRKGVWARSTR
jgi:endonuclease YncB( thermonuclease family)